MTMMMAANTQQKTRSSTSPRVMDDQICVDNLGIGSKFEIRCPLFFFDNPEFILVVRSSGVSEDRRKHAQFPERGGVAQYRLR